MILIDTSCWIESIRSTGDPSVRKRVHDLMDAGEAAWCDAVRLELWNSSRAVQDARILKTLEGYVSLLPVDEPVMKASVDLAARARSSGLTVPSLDLIIAACAMHHRVAIESRDGHFKKLLFI